MIALLFIIVVALWGALVAIVRWAITADRRLARIEREQLAILNALAAQIVSEIAGE